MFKIRIRPLIGLAIALALTMVALPETASGSGGTEATVEAAALHEPVVSPIFTSDLAAAARSVVGPAAPARSGRQGGPSAHLVAPTPPEPTPPEPTPPEPAPPEPTPAPQPAPEPAPTPAPQPAPEPAPAPKPVPAAPAVIAEIIERHFGPAADQAKRVAHCESRMDPNATSGTNDHGLFQINHVHRGQFEAVTGRPWSEIYDAELNTAYAKWLYDQEGWRPWVCRHAA